MDMDDEIEEGPISDPASCMETVKKKLRMLQRI